MLLSYVFRFDLYRLADTERLEEGACGSPYWWLLHWSSGAGPKGGALLPGVLYSLEGGTPLETIGGMTSRLLKPQHLYGISSGLTPYRLPLDTLGEYPEP